MTPPTTSSPGPSARTPDLERPAWWVPRVLAAVVATVAVVAGPGWLAGDRGGTGPAEVAADGDAQGVTEDVDEPRDVAVTTYAAGTTPAGTRLRADRHLVEDATGTPLEVAVQQLLASQVVDDDLRPAWPADDEVRVAVRVGGDRVAVDLAGLDTDAEVAPPAARLALQALVWTVDTATRSRLPVEVLIDGAPADELWGVDVGAPVPPEAGALAGVQVESPADAAVVSSAFTVHGWTRADDGRVAWQLRDGDEVVRSGAAVSGSGAGGVAPYELDVSSPVGDFTLVVTSDGDRDTKQLRVR